MNLPFFLSYLGSLLVISILISVMVKSFAEGYASQGKAPMLYGSISSILASAAVFLSVYFSAKNLFNLFWIFSAIYLVFGIIHRKIVHDKYFYSRPDNKTKVFTGELLYGISVVLFSILVFSSLQYFLKGDKDFLFYPMMMSTLAFFIPSLFMQTFQAAIEIPPAEFTTWQYPLHEQIDLPEEDPREKLIVIGFEIAKKTTDSKKTYFRAKAPENFRLGELYYHFINDYNELNSETTIAFTNNLGQSYEWWFRIKTKWYQRARLLEPYRSIRENGIAENDVIICERVPTND